MPARRSVGERGARLQSQGQAEPGAPCPSVPLRLCSQMKPCPRRPSGFGKSPGHGSDFAGVMPAGTDALWKSRAQRLSRVIKVTSSRVPSHLPETCSGPHPAGDLLSACRTQSISVALPSQDSGKAAPLCFGSTHGQLTPASPQVCSHNPHHERCHCRTMVLMGHGSLSRQ